jgi:hypothetical protein
VFFMALNFGKRVTLGFHRPPESVLAGAHLLALATNSGQQIARSRNWRQP